MHDLASGIGYTTIILVIILVGGILNNKLARFSPTFTGTNGKNNDGDRLEEQDRRALHKRLTGYTALDATEYFAAIQNETVCSQDTQLTRYKKLLKLDYFFAVFYALSLFLYALYFVQKFALPGWLLLFPPLYLIADFSENWRLITAITLYREAKEGGSPGQRLSRHIAAASLSTVAKLIFIMLTVTTVMTAAITQMLTAPT